GARFPSPPAPLAFGQRERLLFAQPQLLPVRRGPLVLRRATRRPQTRVPRVARRAPRRLRRPALPPLRPTLRPLRARRLQSAPSDRYQAKQIQSRPVSPDPTPARSPVRRWTSSNLPALREKRSKRTPSPQ